MSVSNMFTSGARNILKALSAVDAASGKAFEVTQREITLFLDKCTLASVPKDKAGCARIADAIKGAFVDAVATGQIESKTVTEYAQGAQRAYYHGVAWYPRLKNDPEMALPWGKAKGTKSGAKSGAVRTTNETAVIKTMVKALEQLRLMGRAELAAGQLDLILELDPEFVEAQA